MATRYLNAMDHADLHAKKVIRKYSQNRPLGEIEKKYHYIVPQATLSTTVDIDYFGTGLCRPNSTVGGWVGASGYPKPRKTNSAPVTKLRRPEPSWAQDQSRSPAINVSIQGRPATGIPGKPKTINVAKTSYLRRPKTTGRLSKGPSYEGFMVIKVDPDLLISSRRKKELTNQIREQWHDSNHDVSTGCYVRGQGAENSGVLGMTTPRSAGQWLTFSGPKKQEGHGVVDAFASPSGDGQNYSIDGYSGSRVAQQLQKGGKIRIGVNGDSKSPEKKMANVKKCVKKQNDESTTYEQPPLAQPLCWTDQLSWPLAKIIQPRSPPLLKTIPILCETHPVVFQKLITDDCPIPRLATPVRSSVYKGVKQRGKKPQSKLGTNNAAQLDRDNLNGLLTLSKDTERNSFDFPRNTDTVNKNNDIKTEISVSSSDGDTRIVPSMSKQGRKSCRSAGANSIRREVYGSARALQKIKPSPASFQAHSKSNPELNITVTGSKTEFMSPRQSAKTEGVQSSSKVYSCYSPSPSSTYPSHTGMQAEFIHFSTGLITPLQRRNKSPQSATSLITKVKEHNQHQVAFGDEGNKLTENDCQFSEEVSKRPNTPISPMPFTASVPLSEEIPNLNSSIAFSIPTAATMEESIVNSTILTEESTTAANKNDVHYVDNQQNEDTHMSDPIEDAISSSVPISSAMSDHSDYSSHDSSLSMHSEEEIHSTNSATSSKPRLTVRFQPGLPDERDAPTVNEILSRPLNGDQMNASAEVKRLRQQIKDDLQKQQEDTQSDIEYLRLRESINHS